MEAEIRARTGEVLDSLPRGEVFDWVDTVSIELTTGMLAILFGFPWEDRRLLTLWSDWAGDTELATVRDMDEMRWSFLQEMGAYFQSLWIERTMDKEPGSDLISMMLHSEAMNQMRPEEFMGNLVLLIVGGNDTTRNTMSGIIHAMDKFPDQRKLFEEQPELIPNAVQEILRMQVPLAHMRRTCTEDTEVFGQQIKAGDKVVLWYLSANRDEEVFDRPDEFDVSRHPNPHISFGWGPHLCLGANLARLELRSAYQEIFTRLSNLQFLEDDYEPVYSHSSFVRGIQSLPVTFAASR
jgi:cytochrome P450